ncbi:class I SAM-dependent methyltransferase [Methanoregula sp.]|uniref:class I SAM-dependent methyltransferase n=1 Tax=Methanoregula sp. TaxID=2052170 RepID=UPI002C62A943|nr:class I SAM-dependent methyltransferase [Methanoregula sp.]HVP97428.1 class I SAM-dependent methyltransferase [Methanoregula sp.]
MKIDEMYTNGQYLKHNPGWGAEDAAWKADQIFSMIRRQGIKPSTICEAGCGSGEILRQLQLKMDENCVFTGYDISPQAIDFANRHTNPNLTFQLADISEEKEKTFDLILLIDLIEHLEDYFAFLRILKNKSPYKILHIPLEMFAISTLYPSFHLGQKRKVGHLHFFSRETALQMLRDLGYEIVNFQYTAGYRLPCHDYGMKDKMLGVPRRLLYPLAPDLTVRIFGGYSLLVLVK